MYNVKQTSLKRPCLSEQDWEELEEQDDEENQEEVQEAEADVSQSLRSSRLVFRTEAHCFSMWKTVVCNSDSSLASCQTDLQRLATSSRWAVLLISGGRFAGAIFTQREPVEHKAFQRYTVRRKQGGTQATKDNQSGTSQPKSIGASLRRKEAQRFVELTEQTLKQWAAPLTKCDLIFIFAPSANYGTLFFTGSPLKKDDSRLRGIPFPLRRPTFGECVRVQKWLSTVEIDPPQESLQAPPAVATEEKKKKKKSKAGDAKEPQPTDGVVTIRVGEDKGEKGAEEEEEEEGEELVRAAIVANDLEALQQCYKEGGGDTAAPLVLAAKLGRLDLLPTLLKHEKVNEVDLDTLQSALHVSCANGSVEAVELLLESGADPTLRDSRDQTAYHLCKTKQTRLALRRFAGEHPDKWAYDFPVLDAAEEEQQKQAKKDAKARKKQREKETKEKKREEKEAEAAKEAEKAKQAKEAAEMAKAVLAREAQIKTMTPRERALEAAQRRLSAQQGTANVCDSCKAPLVRTPFERLTFKYCSTECLRKHRDELDKVK